MWGAGHRAVVKYCQEVQEEASQRPRAGIGVEPGGLIREASPEEENMGHSVKGETGPGKSESREGIT